MPKCPWARHWILSCSWWVRHLVWLFLHRCMWMGEWDATLYSALGTSKVEKHHISADHLPWTLWNQLDVVKPGSIRLKSEAKQRRWEIIWLHHTSALKTFFLCILKCYRAETVHFQTICHQSVSCQLCVYIYVFKVEKGGGGHTICTSAWFLRNVCISKGNQWQQWHQCLSGC